jgi:hypothetical protein
MLGKAMTEKERLISELEKELEVERKRREEIAAEARSQARQFEK